MREYKGNRRERDDRGVSPIRGGTPSAGTEWSPGGAASVSREPATPAPGTKKTTRNGRFSSTVFVTSTSSEQVIAENKKRVYLGIQNRGANAVTIGFGQKATDDGSFRLTAGSFYEPYISPDNSVHIKGAVAGDNVVIIEGFDTE